MKPSGGNFGKVNLQELAKLKFIDSWLISYFRKLPEEFEDWSIEKKYLVYEMANQNPSAEDIRAYYSEEQRKDSIKVKDTDFIKSAKEEFGIDLEEFNQAVEAGDLDL